MFATYLRLARSWPTCGEGVPQRLDKSVNLLGGVVVVRRHPQRPLDLLFGEVDGGVVAETEAGIDPLVPQCLQQRLRFGIGELQRDDRPQPYTTVQETHSI